MCGIAGILDHNCSIEINAPLLDKMAAPLRYRGPDQSGTYLFSNEHVMLGFVHRRLSIIDLSEKAKQPMQDDEGKLTLIFNGEVYNYNTLKSSLKHKEFKSSSDTEIVLYAIKEWGFTEALRRIQGMFALALFDHPNETLYLARDRFGEKPLYYFNQHGVCAFSSDIRSFSALPLKKTLNQTSIGYFLGEMSTPGEETIWNEVKKLAPAHFLKVNRNTAEILPFWSPDYRKKVSISSESILNGTEKLLEKAVQNTMVSDVPVGCFLSGGIDSSLVAMYAAKHANEKLKTFTVGFDFDLFNEAEYAHYVSKLIKSEHHEVTLSHFLLDEVNVLLKEYGEPFADSSAIATYYISKFASEHVKVCIGGDGGDELFGGYGSHTQAYRMQQWFRLKFLRGILSGLSSYPKARYLEGIMAMDPAVLSQALHRGMGFSNDQLMQLTGDEHFSNSVTKEHIKAMKKALEFTDTPFDAVLCGSIMTRLPNDYLVKTDRASMFNSLELRTPFLDKELFEFTSSLPWHQLMKGGMNKYLTKMISRKYFSTEFVDRPKMGFGVPIGEWMKKAWKNQVGEVILSDQPALGFHKSYIEKLWNQHQSGKIDHTHRIWTLYVLNKWLEDQTLA
jgi:asparagine synthase (glutamine-hydrolysing)